MNNQSKILIIDDEDVVLDSCKQILKGSSHKIATATDGTLGLSLLSEFQPDLVYVDLKMPGIPGLDVVEKVHEFDPTIVTIVITGFATVSSAVEAMKNGAYDFLPKPFTPDEFRLITQRGLDRRRLIRETIALKREKEMLREQFAAIVSHELKSPLSAIQQNLYYLMDELSDQLTVDQMQKFERMKIKINDLIDMIHTWLRVLSVDVNKIKQYFKATEVKSIISKSLESVQSYATRKDIELCSSIQEPLGFVNGDEGTLVEVVVNILGNAIKFSRVGSQVSLHAERAGDEILISVTDHGIGIAKEDLSYIFHDFYAKRSDQIAEQSSGLGLGIARRIVEVHGGSVSVESELGKGSIFVIHLPLMQEESVPGPQQGLEMAKS